MVCAIGMAEYHESITKVTQIQGADWALVPSLAVAVSGGGMGSGSGDAEGCRSAVALTRRSWIARP